MTKYLINSVEDVLNEIDTLVSHYKYQRDKKEMEGRERMSISYQGSILGLLMLKANITGKSLAEMTEMKWADVNE